uniref:ATPase inhibitor, mitochondrial n=1 Tax=Araucaria cunninghamii TaxID=56994 RepID=A0A0D6QRT4_ARACU
MMRTQLVKLTRAVPRQATRSFSVAAVRAAEGDVGGTRSGGSATGDAFSKREKANEDYFIRNRERETLKALKSKLAAQRQHLDELEKHVDELSKEHGGEQH